LLTDFTFRLENIYQIQLEFVFKAIPNDRFFLRYADETIQEVYTLAKLYKTAPAELQELML
jgi:hypothetical protein